MSVTIDIEDNISPELIQFSRRLSNRQPLHATMGQRVAVLTRRHFVSRDQEGNKKGWPRSNFWLRFQNTTSRATADSATIEIPDPQGALRHKIEGGTITPKRSKYLAIPLAPEAKVAGGKSSFRDAFPDAFVIKGSKNLLLARPDAGRGGRGGLRLLAVLVRSVTHKADDRALPADREIESEAVRGAENYLARAARRLQS